MSHKQRRMPVWDLARDLLFVNSNFNKYMVNALFPMRLSSISEVTAFDEDGRLDIEIDRQVVFHGFRNQLPTLMENRAMVKNKQQEES